VSEFTLINSFVRRLNKIGINIELIGNYPWVYIRAINGVTVKEMFCAKHGFTAFFVTNSTKFSDRREVFKLIRLYMTRSKDNE